MSQQMDANMASNPIHGNCIKTNANNADDNRLFLNIDLGATSRFNDMSCIQKCIESNGEVIVETAVETPIKTTSKSEAAVIVPTDDIQNIPISKTVIEVVVESKEQKSVETNADPMVGINGDPMVGINGDPMVGINGDPMVGINGDPMVGINGDPMVGTDSVTECQPKPKPESSAKSLTKYIRKTSTEMLAKIWLIVDSNEWHKNEDQMNKYLIKNMFNLFNIKLNENRIKQMMETAVDDRLVIIEEADDKIRYVLNFDPKLFGELTNDWFCFECHSVLDGEDPIGCKKCFKAFHLQCLKGEHKVQNLKEESFVCLYCRRLAETEGTLKVDRLPKSDLNKCISFVLNNLQLSFESQIFDSYGIEDNEKNKVLLFKGIDIMTIRHKALTEQYLKLEEMLIDFKHFCHNFSICNRDQSTQLKDFERRFNHEIKELKLCVDCYKYSSDITYDIEDDPHDWFTLVCDPPHELVFAKYGKYPFWPAKVIEMKAGGKQYDVRFFDAPDFSRAIIPLQRLRAIEGFDFGNEDEDNDLELPVKLMEKHIARMRSLGVYFMPTVINQKRSAKKRRNTDTKASDRPLKRSKKTAPN